MKYFNNAVHCSYLQLAQHGMNVVLMSRSSQKLEKVAETIGQFIKPLNI